MLLKQTAFLGEKPRGRQHVVYRSLVLAPDEAAVRAQLGQDVEVLSVREQL